MLYGHGDDFYNAKNEVKINLWRRALSFFGNQPFVYTKQEPDLP